jgi:hypothetical protein
VIEEEQPRLEFGRREPELGIEQCVVRVNIEIGRAGEDAGILPAVEHVPRRDEAQPA